MTRATATPSVATGEPAPAAATHPSRHCVGIEARGLVVRAGGRRLLDDVSLSIGAGELVAVMGASGAGKTTLLESLAGLRPLASGAVRFIDDKVGPATAGRTGAPALGYVPQDDIIHNELALDRTLYHAALLRLPAATTRESALEAVGRVLELLQLRSVAEVRVGALSGGQRKRASIAVELLGKPSVCFLDEPTSGLDPGTASAFTRVLQSLAGAGSTVVFTTHAAADVERCDRVVALGTGGRLLFSGPVADALRHFGVSTIAEIYEVINHTAPPSPESERSAPASSRSRRGSVERAGSPRMTSPSRQWRVLTVRAAETLVRNRLTLAILVGSPALVTAMFALLFRPGAFDPTDANATAEVMVTFWIAFAGFFFGLTFGLLQVCTEVPILRRERHAGVSMWAYLFSKIALLVPFLAVVDVVMLAVLRSLDRLPDASLGIYLSLAVTFLLDAIAALCIGLLASAAVNSPAQAALALPMLCFPAVLFAGAMVPLTVMAGGGRAIALFMVDRWAFEALARDLGIGSSPTTSVESDALGGHAATHYWLILCGFVVVLLFAARAMVALRARPASR